MRGSIQKRNGKRGVSWCVVYDEPTPSGGRRQRRKSFPRKREAEAFLAAVQHELRSGGYVAPSDLTVGTLLDRWLEAHAANVRPATIARYRRAARVHLQPALGALELQPLSPLAIHDFYQRKLAAGLTPAGVRMLHKVLRGALDQAVAWQLVPRNAAATVKPPREPRCELAVWDANQVATFLAATEDDPIRGALYRLAILTGMRRGELLALRWSDVDLPHALLTVRRTVTEGLDGRDAVGDTKSAAGRRAIALPASCVEALHRHRAAQAGRRLRLGAAWQDRGLVFDRGDGAAIHGDTLGTAFHRASDAAGLPRIRLHDLRHTAATLALAQGVHPKVVQERLGHSSIAMTLDRYSHVSVELQREAAARLDAALATAGTSRDQIVTNLAESA